MHSSSSNMRGSWPEDVGILALEVYFPSTYVDQDALENYDGVSKGKYTIGLGQKAMGFCGDREDIHSLSLTVVKRILEKNCVDPKNVGRLEVGTETLIDKSKSVKSVLMQLFAESGNSSLEGVDTTNACYGGTQALFNSLAWLESSAWDGRLAIVVAADIAVYGKGPARCTGGAGAIAMLLGPNAPLVIERGLRSVHMEHVYDFYKPEMDSEYPWVEGKLSVNCYLRSLDICYQRYIEKASKILASSSRVTLDSFDYFAFHTPFCKLVQKSLARLMLNDFQHDPDPDVSEGGRYAAMENLRDVRIEDTLVDEVKGKEVERASMKASLGMFESKTKPSLLVAQQVGNTYTSSLYGGLASLLASVPVEDLAGKRIGMFSYGSGLAAAMFSVKVSMDTSAGGKLAHAVSTVSDIPEKLKSRHCIQPEGFYQTLKLREKTHHLNNYTPQDPVEELFPGSYYLTHVDSKHRRTYMRKSLVDDELELAALATRTLSLKDAKKKAADHANELLEVCDIGMTACNYI